MNYKELSEKVSYIFFPKRCKYCGRVIVPKDDLCEDCKTALPIINEPVCRYCGCSKEDCSCNKKKNYYSEIVAPFYYEGAIKSAVNRMKFKSNALICKTMADDMYKVFLREYKDIDFDFICFVPFSPSNIKSKEFNQSEVIAKLLSEKTGIGVTDALCCLFDIKSQHFLKGDGRRGNVVGAYDIKQNFSVEGKTVLLVDDIKTTGSTLDECAKMLRIYGAEKVYAITFAITKMHGKTNVDSLD